MAGTLTLGGMADGLLSGQVTVGPFSMNGKQAISEVINVELAANVDTAIKVPPEAVAYAVSFAFVSSPAEVKLGSNLSATSTGLSVLAQGFIALPLNTGVTEVKFRSPGPPPTFQLIFI